jgi:hypothetical protein
VPVDDLQVVIEAINRWNVIYGLQFGAVVVPIHWTLHSVAEHGERPQGSLNQQLVEGADVVVALFWHRLGSPTGEEESGTIEEIKKAHDAGAYVAILRSTRDFPRDADLDQVARLRQFYDDLRRMSLMLEYSDGVALARHVDAILMRAVTREGARAAAVVEKLDTGADVWPRVESSERVKTDSRGRVKTDRRWQLVLANAGPEAARTVRHRFEPERDGEELPMQIDEDRELETLAPGGQASYGLYMHIGTAPQARCVVTWEDSTGQHENQATLRFF